MDNIYNNFYFKMREQSSLICVCVLATKSKGTQRAKFTKKVANLFRNYETILW